MNFTLIFFLLPLFHPENHTVSVFYNKKEGKAKQMLLLLTITGCFCSTQGAKHYSRSAADSAFYFQRTKRTVNFTGPAFHAGIKINNNCFPIPDSEYFVRTDF